MSAFLAGETPLRLQEVRELEVTVLQERFEFFGLEVLEQWLWWLLGTLLATSIRFAA